MKWSALLLAFTLALAAQSTRTINYDGMGRPVTGPSTTVTSSGGVTSRTQTLQSLNGRSVPLGSTEERVVRDDAQGRVVERVVRHYDAEGNPGTVERVMVETEKRSDGGSTVRTTTYRSDVNGNLALAERSVSESRKSGNTISTEETVDRPSINGALETAEKRSVVARETGDGESRSTVLYRRGQDGRLYEAQRQVSETKSGKDESQQNETTYETSPTGVSRLLSQTVTHSKKSPDGSEQTVVDVFTGTTPGVSTASTGKPQLREQQVIRRRASSNGTSETVDVRRPTLADPGRLGSPVRISETVCTGKCP